MREYINISQEVKEALKNNKAVVALESTIISHGMPYPENVKMALNVEKITRAEGAVPATIAILDGVIKIGLSPDEIEILAKAKNVYKVGKRDFAYVVSKKLIGATTVSGTSLAAAMAGIKVFATGGIGGVHRGATETFDISRDLEELSEVDICVICAGAKSILDLGLTLEYLETKGVEVIGYQTKELPAFYSRESGFNVNYQLDTPKEIASLLKAKWELGLHGGVVVANPIPKEFSMDAKIINDAIDQALVEAKSSGIKGNEVTPFLLSKIKHITEGSSLESNIELVYNNAKLAAQIAFEYANKIE
ncbi:MAG: pseudouridine-5-phosphate glycosidase [Tenericutes bacterium HGW-Tenericutes-2]|jgi:pseudouridine-5'-phosphate glycosidase|nr:MAG: pseudouridine-5-phosphate glycosidase [Tenericutes bacterium HGW-Tenericutes-2]